MVKDETTPYLLCVGEKKRNWEENSLHLPSIIVILCRYIKRCKRFIPSCSVLTGVKIFIANTFGEQIWQCENVWVKNLWRGTNRYVLLLFLVFGYGSFPSRKMSKSRMGSHESWGKALMWMSMLISWKGEGRYWGVHLLGLHRTLLLIQIWYGRGKLDSVRDHNTVFCPKKGD